MKILTEKQATANCLTCELQNLISEFNNKTLTTEGIFNYFSNFLIDANVDSRIVVEVLEEERFGEEGKTKH